MRERGLLMLKAFIVTEVLLLSLWLVAPVVQHKATTWLHPTTVTGDVTGSPVSSKPTECFLKTTVKRDDDCYLAEESQGDNGLTFRVMYYDMEYKIHLIMEEDSIMEEEPYYLLFALLLLLVLRLLSFLKITSLKSQHQRDITTLERRYEQRIDEIKQKKEEEEEEEEEEEDDPIVLLLTKRDIWVHNILPFLGVGNYIFVAGVCKDMKELYQDYYSSVEKEDKPNWVQFPANCDYRKPLLTDTFYREAFASLSRAKFWWNENNQQNGRRADQLPDDLICEKIAKYGNVLTLEWAHKQRGFRWGEYTCSNAAGAGRLDVLQYAHENGCPWNGRTCYEAAKAGRLDILQYAHDNGCPWDEYTCSEAAGAGRLDILRYAHENGCPWSTSTCLKAAQQGRLDILQYAHENGCPWDKYTLDRAILNGHQEIVEYARANGCPEPSPDMMSFHL